MSGASRESSGDTSNGASDWLVPNSVALCLLTGIVVLLGAVFGHACVTPSFESPRQGNWDFVSGLAAWDGDWYARILSNGYDYDEDRASNVAFFPAFPLVASILTAVTGMRAELALVLVSNSFFCLAFVLLAKYWNARFGTDVSHSRDFVLLSFGLFPTTFYFRMAYTESMFVCLAIAALYGMYRKWPLAIIAPLIGVATATRAVGVALLPCLVAHIWTNWRGAPRAARLLIWLPVASWGLLAFMTYLSHEFGEPLAFVKTQRHWNMRPLPENATEGALALATFEPMRAVYEPACICYWGTRPPKGVALFNLLFANPLYFAATVALVGIGWWQRWLTRQELLYSFFVLLIPFVIQAYRFCMASQGRFCVVAFPVFLVLAQLLRRCPPSLTIALAGLSGFMLGAYSALFVTSHAFY
jgi:hypothetical protein